MSELTQTVMRFKRTGAGFEEVEKRACMLIYDFPRSSPGIDEDTKGDFLLYMLPRLRGIVERYHPREVAFEGYLFICMRWKLKSFLRQRSLARLHTRIEQDKHVWEDVRREPLVQIPLARPHRWSAPDDGVSYTREAGEAGFGGLMSRNANLVYFCLKAVCDIREEQLPRVARLCNVNAEWLAHCRHLLMIRCSGRRQRLSHLRYRQEALYEKLRLREELLLHEVDPEKKAALRARIRKIKHTYNRCSYEADHVNLRPTNWDIADLLNVPKGSVDSGVAQARKVITRFLGTPERDA